MWKLALVSQAVGLRISLRDPTVPADVMTTEDTIDAPTCPESCDKYGSEVQALIASECSPETSPAMCKMTVVAALKEAHVTSHAEIDTCAASCPEPPGGKGPKAPLALWRFSHGPTPDEDNVLPTEDDVDHPSCPQKCDKYGPEVGPLIQAECDSTMTPEDCKAKVVSKLKDSYPASHPEIDECAAVCNVPEGKGPKGPKGVFLLLRRRNDEEQWYNDNAAGKDQAEWMPICEQKCQEDPENPNKADCSTKICPGLWNCSNHDGKAGDWAALQGCMKAMGGKGKGGKGGKGHNFFLQARKDEEEQWYNDNAAGKDQAEWMPMCEQKCQEDPNNPNKADCSTKICPDLWNCSNQDGKAGDWAALQGCMKPMGGMGKGGKGGKGKK